MPALCSYLLRTKAQEAYFREYYAGFIEKNYRAYEEWFLQLPLYQWVEFRPRPGMEEVATGLLCLLYIDGHVNLSFSGDMHYLRHEAQNTEEYYKWLQWQGPARR